MNRCHFGSDLCRNDGAGLTHSDIAFPLTPALSLRERGNRRQSHDDSKRAGLANGRATILPLPWGI